jgi:hypothetical protein
MLKLWICRYIHQWCGSILCVCVCVVFSTEGYVDLACNTQWIFKMDGATIKINVILAWYFKKNAFSGQIFLSITKSHITWKSIQLKRSYSVWTEGTIIGRAKRHDKTNSRSLQFCERTKKWWHCGSYGRVRELKGTCNMQDVKEKYACAYCRTWCVLCACVTCV